MAATVKSVKIEGLSDLETALGELPKATGKNCIRRALAAAAILIADAAEARAPRGKTGKLKASIAVSKVTFTSGAAAAGKAAFAKAMKERATRAEARAAAQAAARAAAEEGGAETTAGVVVVGPSRIPRAIFVEFGTYKMGQKPYMRPAWDTEQRAAFDAIKETLTDQIKKSAERQARKVARRAAQVSK